MSEREREREREREMTNSTTVDYSSVSLESKKVSTLERGDSMTARVGPRLKTDGARLTLQAAQVHRYLYGQIAPSCIIFTCLRNKALGCSIALCHRQYKRLHIWVLSFHDVFSTEKCDKFILNSYATYLIILL